MSQVDGVRAAVLAAAIGRQAGASGRAAAVRRAAAALPPGQQQVLQQLLEGMYAAISQDGSVAMLGLRAPPTGPLWQEACLAYLGTCSEAQLAEWRWHIGEDQALQGRSAEVELLPYLLHGSRAAIRKVHYDKLRADEDAYDAEFREDPEVDDYGYFEGAQEIALQAMWAFQDSMKQRDRLLRPLLEAAVRAGAAPLPLATVRSLEEHERKFEWGGAGAAWADSWEPKAEAHARFHPRFRAAVRTLLLANRRGLPGTDHNGRPIHLPSEVLLGIVRGMAAPDAEAAWVPQVGPLPAWIDLNSDM